MQGVPGEQWEGASHVGEESRNSFGTSDACTVLRDGEDSVTMKRTLICLLQCMRLLVKSQRNVGYSIGY